MDDRRIEQALRDGPPDEPAYRAGVAKMLDESALIDGLPDGVTVQPHALRAENRARTRGPNWLLPLAAVVTIAVAGLAIRFNQVPGASPSAAPDMLAQIRAAGVIRIAVSNEAPQTPTSGGAYAGFDIDVAKAVAQELGVRADLTLVPPASILQGSGDWALALPSTVLPIQLQGAAGGPAYYDWPSWIVVETASAVTAVGDLDGARICVVAGSAGAAWVAGAPVRDVAFAAVVPLGPIAVERPNDEACASALASGDADAAITSTLLDIDLASNGLRAVGTDPLMTNRRVVLIRDATGLGDPTSLQTALDAAIRALRGSGQLDELSRRSFGGQDLTGALP